MRPVFDVLEKIVKCRRLGVHSPTLPGDGQKKIPGGDDPPGICAGNCRFPNIGAKHAASVNFELFTIE